jgi:hypothetical protein
MMCFHMPECLLISLDGDDTIGTRHLHCGVGTVDDRHKLQEERPPKMQS